MPLFESLITITLIHVLAAASPGPDFVLVTQKSLAGGRRAGILCSLGIALGLSIHMIYSAMGLAAVIAHNADYLFYIKLLGASYLIYLGVQGLRSRKQYPQSISPENAPRESARKLISTGFLCNALNPKAPLYFVSLFTLVISPEMPGYQLLILCLWMMTIQFGWFSAVTLLLSRSKVRNLFQTSAHWLDRVLGSAMLFFGIKILLSKSTE
mgnify:CR=1 FL=1